MPSNVTSGYAQKDPNGLILWSTFTTSSPSGTGWYPAFKVACSCDVKCGIRMYSREPLPVFYVEEFEFDTGGESLLTFYYGAMPTKYLVYKNNTLVLETDFGGLPAYQSVVDLFTSNNNLPPETISTTPQTSYTETLGDGDILKVEVWNVSPVKSDYYYVVGCTGNTNCLMSDWGQWSAWVDNGDGTKTRTRTRTIIREAEGSGTPCGPTTETQTITADVDCVLSEWGDWSSWTDNGNGTKTRTRTRTVVTPPSGSGADCGPLFESETVDSAVDCVVSDWSAWSEWEDNGNMTESRTRTRTVVVPPANGGTACGPLSETQTRDIINCVVSDWSAWSSWEEETDEFCRTRTRIVVTPPVGENAAPCPPLTETECGMNVSITVKAEDEELIDIANFEVEFYDGDGPKTGTVSDLVELNIVGYMDFATMPLKVLAIMQGTSLPPTNMKIVDDDLNVWYDDDYTDSLILVPPVTNNTHILTVTLS